MFTYEWIRRAHKPLTKTGYHKRGRGSEFCEATSINHGKPPTGVLRRIKWRKRPPFSWKISQLTYQTVSKKESGRNWMISLKTFVVTSLKRILSSRGYMEQNIVRELTLIYVRPFWRTMRFLAHRWPLTAYMYCALEPENRRGAEVCGAVKHVEQWMFMYTHRINLHLIVESKLLGTYGQLKPPGDAHVWLADTSLQRNFVNRFSCLDVPWVSCTSPKNVSGWLKGWVAKPRVKAL